MMRSEEHTSELQSHVNLVCRLLLEKKKKKQKDTAIKNKKLKIKDKSIKKTSKYSTNHISISMLSMLSVDILFFIFFFFFFNDTATTEIYTLSLHDALPI